MSDTVINVERVSKLYRLGEIGTGSLAHDVNRWWHRVRGKEDPYSKIAEGNDRSRKGESEYVWALKDVSFEVKRGEVLGIIGRNGAGKSTLLKILSRVTTPTKGEIKVRGRIASLLEVGTGFNPEMTGRENIYLNGAILGMRKKEIDRKLDEITDFAGVERYIDTPVKRYSSGMYVRLAFAVAAHLEPEILIVDEVLAVGDAEFQKKCLDKMGAVATSGNTILFVSHNMASLRQLCARAVTLNQGRVIDVGLSADVIERYIRTEIEPGRVQDLAIDARREGSGRARVRAVEITDGDGSGLQSVGAGDCFKLVLKCEAPSDFRLDCVVASIALLDDFDRYVWLVRSNFQNQPLEVSGCTEIHCHIEDFALGEGRYRGVVFLSYRDSEILDHVVDAFELNVVGGDFFKTASGGLPAICPTLTRSRWSTQIAAFQTASARSVKP